MSVWLPTSVVKATPSEPPNNVEKNTNNISRSTYSGAYASLPNDVLGDDKFRI
jgi:hypothetical protein